VLQELFGVNANIRDVAKCVAGLGYVAVAPELFHRTAIRFEGPYDDFSISMPHAQKMTAEGLEADLRAVHDWVGRDDQANGERVAAWGFCMGGRVALLAQAILPLRAAVSLCGGVTDTLLPQLPRLSGPVLLVWGGLDKHLGPVTQRRLVDALKEAKKPLCWLLAPSAAGSLTKRL
jgi:carboxymethylenebutenolidase